MEMNPVGETTERFFGNVDVPNGGYTGKKDDKPRLVYDHDNENIDVHGTLEYQDDSLLWDDIQVSISNIKIPPASAPTERWWDHGIAAGVEFAVLGFAVDDYMSFDVQTSHSMKLNTILDNHIHFSLPNTTNIGDKFKFQLDVIAAGIGGIWAVPIGSPFTAEYTIVAGDNINHKLLETATIPASNTTVSTIYKCRMTRIAASANEYGSEVYMHYNDSHYQKDTGGSRQEASK